MRKVGIVFMGAAVAAGLKLDTNPQRQKTTEPTLGWDAPEYDAVWDVPLVENRKVGDLSRQWVCGNDAQRKEDHLANPIGSTTSIAAMNSKAGIQLLRGPARQGSLEWVKEGDSGHLNDADRDSLWWRKSWSDLFCSDYIGGYQNPRAESVRGVCLRDKTPGWRWKSIVQADDDAKALWEYFGNVKGSFVTPLEPHLGGYQKASSMFRDFNNMSWNYRWGSGGWGSLPPNWCQNYMKQFLCHVSFPQYAGPAPADLPAWIAGDTTHTNPQEIMVRPVCNSFAETIMDACNRAEPVYDDVAGTVKSVEFGFLQKTYAGSGLFAGRRLQDLTQTLDEDEKAGDVREFAEMNSFWISVFNRGFGIAVAGTGVGDGDDAEVAGPDGSYRFCASWEAAPASAPALALVVVAALLNVFM